MPYPRCDSLDVILLVAVQRIQLQQRWGTPHALQCKKTLQQQRMPSTVGNNQQNNMRKPPVTLLIFSSELNNAPRTFPDTCAKHFMHVKSLPL
jgi:hypothetical protein